MNSNIIKLDLSHKWITSIDLSPLETCTQLKSLNLIGNNLTSIDLTPLESCSNLQGLYLYLNQLSSIDLTPIGACTHLRFLDLFRNLLTTIDFAPLISCARLEKLCLSENLLKKISFVPFKTCNLLQEIDLSGNNLESIDIAPFASCTNIKTLWLYSNEITSIDLTPLGSWTNLQELSLQENKLKSIDLTPLSSCSELRYLNLGANQIQTIDLSPLSTCANLGSILLAKNPISEIDVDTIYSLDLHRFETDLDTKLKLAKNLFDIHTLPEGLASSVKQIELVEVLPDSIFIFISLNHKDLEVGKFISSTLSERGYTPRLYDLDVAPGDSFIKFMQESINQSKVMLLLWSENAKESYWVNKEYRDFLVKLSKDPTSKIIVITLDYTEIPTLLREGRYISYQKVTREGNPKKRYKEKLISEILWGITGERPDS